MTDGPVNLNRVRKQRARAERQARADQNAARFGRTKAQKILEEAEADKARRTLDQHRREEK
ncbi:MAG: DUF4169 domain-containing protein [Alphaproteobacteria bacterium HGW-Alphaproteobacteria-1]|jgi:hypothetical protein|nr:MAG: DUF4169 domain-containing protein [Alphaproteobacteria bacterium HGW-Alphaproteobacteria-1]